MLINDIGILGIGVWDGPAISNDYFGERFTSAAQVKDPYKGRRSEDGTLRIAGMELSPAKFKRTLAQIEQSFHDPFRGTRRRRYFPRDLKVSDAETDAAQKALAAAGIKADDVGAVLVQSFLPDEIQPKNAAKIAYNLGIHRAPAWEVDSVCNSAITHITVGSSLILSGFASHVLCVQSTAYSRVADPGSSSVVQEGDLATAFVLGRSPGTRVSASFRTDGRLHGAIKLQWSPPTGAGAPRWWERSEDWLLIRFDHELQEQVMGEIEENARVVCNTALDHGNMGKDELETFIGTQAMSWYSTFLADVLGLRDGVAFDTFTEYGNVSSSGPVATLHEACRSGRIPTGQQGDAVRPCRGLHLRRGGDPLVSAMKLDHVTAIVGDADAAAEALSRLLGASPVATVSLPGMAIRLLPCR